MVRDYAFAYYRVAYNNSNNNIIIRYYYYRVWMAGWTINLYLQDRRQCSAMLRVTGLKQRRSPQSLRGQLYDIAPVVAQLQWAQHAPQSRPNIIHYIVYNIIGLTSSGGNALSAVVGTLLYNATTVIIYHGI